MAESSIALIIEQADTPEKLLQLGRKTEEIERYADMCLVMKKLVEMKKTTNTQLEDEERCMLSTAYKHIIGPKREAFRVIKPQEEADSSNSILPRYREMIVGEIEGTCKEMLDLISDSLVMAESDLESLITKVSSSEGDEKVAAMNQLESQVYYLKMAGDYCRYVSEIKDEEEVKKQAETKYDQALKLAAQLAPTHPTRLGLALNASVCYWEILDKPKKAVELAKMAFDEAIQKLDSLNDDTYKDSTLIMQLLRDNLTVWGKSEDPNEVED